MSISPVQRTLKLLRAEGYLAAVCERWNPHAGCRQDLFGFIDLVAIKEGETGVLAVQVTTHANLATHRKKLVGNDSVRVWLATGNRVELISWAKRGPRGKRKVWTVKRERYIIDSK